MATITNDLLKQIADNATAHANAIKVGDTFTGAFGAAALYGYTDGPERSLFTVIWLSIWEARKGIASGPFDGPCTVERID